MSEFFLRLIAVVLCLFLYGFFSHHDFELTSIYLIVLATLIYLRIWPDCEDD